ncbi:hypothetical protein PLEOSDRAFT_1081688 [Pleurotus ostreatus PC15]|uniref:Uncharacterized protein n=2 Tax=Pleurotus TaxID=5320 RepID=A0A067P2E7_PLEO1|nr:hypothetical protein CCMSSC00406_0009267 [Pleurotus cornucopiae]KDQ30046.1 hypothetical protein PLEOSDRAFT_1081688 [Pleurotus ostreatus PC15]
MAHSLQHIPAHPTEDLRSMKKKEAVVAYETEVQYFAGMGDAMPELDNEHREDVELAVGDMERQQDWLSAAEEILVARGLQGSVEDEVRTRMATATGQLLEAQSRLAEWQAEDERQAQEEREAAEAKRRKEEDERRREAEALEERRAEDARRAAEVRDARRRDALAAEARRQAAQRSKLIVGSGIVGSGSGSAAAERVETDDVEDVIEITSAGDEEDTPVPRTRRRASAIRAGKRKAIESDDAETTPRTKRIRKRAGNPDEALEKTPPPPAPSDVEAYGEYNPADPSTNPRNDEWGCGYGASKDSCPHPRVEFSGYRRCLRCQQANFSCVGTGCHACETCTGSKVKCSHAKTRAKQVRTADGEASGSKNTGEKRKRRGAAASRSRSRRVGEVAESSRTTRAATGSAVTPVLVEACADHELRTLVQVMSSMDARIAALKQATEEAENTRAAATRSLAALILRRELEEAQRAEEADEEERAADRQEDAEDGWE